MSREASPPGVGATGDRRWSEAGAATLAGLARKVRRRARRIQGSVGVDTVHDTRTATRRLRTAIGIYGVEADADDRASVERVLRKVAHRLGAVRDLDILLASLEASQEAGRLELARRDLKPLRKAWRRKRRRAAGMLKRELGRKRFRRALRDAARLLPPPAATGSAVATSPVHRVAGRAPGMIWAAYGEVLAYEIDAATADPAEIHEARKAAKALRYTLEAFEDALEPGATLIAEVEALQDAGGEMHDAIVAARRTRSTLDEVRLRGPERTAAEGFALHQDRRADAQRPLVARSLAAVRGRAFRESLGRAVARMGHVAPADAGTGGRRD